MIDFKLLLASSKEIHIDENDTSFMRRVRFDFNEHCWNTGEYDDRCDCELCMHKEECSGYEGDKD